jgi:(2Fe-2S) ferredoxin
MVARIFLPFIRKLLIYKILLYFKNFDPSRMGSKHTLRAHIFLCNSIKAKCASNKVLEASWTFLKKEIRQRRLDWVVGRTQANCLQICKQGPVAVVFDGHGATWYQKCEEIVLQRIIDEHLVGGKIVDEFRIVNNKAILELEEKVK